MPELELYQLQNLIIAGQKYAVKATLVELGLLKPFLTKAQAYKSYGRGTVDRWIGEGLVKIIKDGDSSSSIRINRMEIEGVAMASNRTTYLPTNER